MTEHLPAGDWNCRACRMPSPCPSQRQRLVAETVDEQQLSIQMWTYYDHYVKDFPTGPVTEAYARFVGWIRARDTQQPAVL